MNNQAFAKGFIKRAQEYGLTEKQAGPLLQQLFGAPDPNKMNPGAWDHIKDQIGLGIGGKSYEQAQQARTLMHGPAQATMPQFRATPPQLAPGSLGPQIPNLQGPMDPTALMHGPAQETMPQLGQR